MIRRTASYIVTLLATIILLAHAVVPHHHHSSKVCVISSHCESDGDAHAHEIPLDNHKHDGQREPDNCILKQLIAIPFERVKPYAKFWGADFDNSDLILDYAVPEDTSSGILDSRVNISPVFPFVYSSYPYLLSCSLGLRAPPIV